MNAKIRNWMSRKKWHNLYLATLFLLIGIALYFALPQEARFKYEYQKGRPWMHATLYAPYNFAIIKSELEIAGEKDSLLKEQVPYFVFADSIAQREMAQLSKGIDRLAGTNLALFAQKCLQRSSHQT